MEGEKRRDIVLWTLPGIMIRCRLINQCLKFVNFMSVMASSCTSSRDTQLVLS